MSTTFTPRLRGCTLDDENRFQPPRIYPALAGMSLGSVIEDDGNSDLPRARGDVPVKIDGVCKVSKFPPRSRGCPYIPAPISNIV